MKVEEFKKMNAENIEKLNKYIDDNYNDIHQMYVSYDMFIWLKLCYPEDCYVKIDNVKVDNEYMKYRGIMTHSQRYYPTKQVNFILRSNYIKFEFPSDCIKILK